MSAVIRVFKNILLLITSILLVVLAVANSTYVSLHIPLVDLSFQLPIFLIIVVSLIIGILLGGGVMGRVFIRRHMEGKAREKRIRILEEELEAVRIRNSSEV